MTSTNDGKDVKSNQTSGQKGKKYYLELYNSIEERLSGSETLAERARCLCEAWRRIHSICRHAAPPSHPILLAWLERHTACVTLQSQWQSPDSEAERTALDDTLVSVAHEIDSYVSERDGCRQPWEELLLRRAEWYRSVLENPWGHPVLKALLDPKETQPDEEAIIEWLKGEREAMFVRRVHELVASRCNDMAICMVAAVMERRRAARPPLSDSEQAEERKDARTPELVEASFENILRRQCGFTDDGWAFLADVELALLHKADRMARFIELAKLTPLKYGYDLIDSLQNRLRKAKTTREKKMWKNVNDVAILIAQIMIARCMVLPACTGTVRSALYRCAHALCALLPSERVKRDMVTLAVPAVTAAHLYTLAKAVHKQRSSDDMKPFVCELFVRAITSGMNELEKLKLKPDEEKEARQSEQTLASWFLELGSVFSSTRLRGECALTAFSVHPTMEMYERIKATPDLPPVRIAEQLEPKTETISEFGSWANDSRSHTNFVKTSEHLNIKQMQQANVLSTAILNEGEALGLGVELCQDISVLLSGPRVKTLSWDLDRELLLSNCRLHMERTASGTRALTTELRFLHLDPRDYQHLQEEDDDENDLYYGIEKGYEHLVEFPEPQPETVWEDDLIFDEERTESAYSTDSEEHARKPRKKKTKKLSYTSYEDEDPLSLAVESKKIEKKKERPHSKERSKGSDTERSKDRKKKTKKERSHSKDKEKKKEKKERKKKIKEEKLSTGPLSHLLGIKVERPIDALESSLAALFADPLESNVEYDGHFSMDELKSPDRESKTPPKLPGSTVSTNQTQIKQDNREQCAEKPKTSSINQEVKNKVAQLLHFRRNNSTVSTDSSNSLTQSPIIPSDVPKAEPKVKTEAMSNLVGSKVIKATQLSTNVLNSSNSLSNVKEEIIPKKVLNRSESLQLSNLKEEISNLLKNCQSQSTEVKTGVNKTINKVTYEPANMKETCSRMVPVKSISKNRVYSIPELQLKYLERMSQKATEDVSLSGYQNTITPQIKKPHIETHGIKSQKSPQEKHMNLTHENHTRQSVTVDHKSPEIPLVSHQRRFEDFVNTLQGSTNAGLVKNPTEERMRRATKPVTKVTPVVPIILKCSRTASAMPDAPNVEETLSQSAKPVVQQKKKNAPNTFSRRCYMHKSKLNDAKPKSVVEQHQIALENQAAIEKSVSEELDKRIADLKLYKMSMKSNQTSVSINKATNTDGVCTKLKESPKVEIIKLPPHSLLADNHADLKDMLQMSDVNIAHRKVDKATKTESTKRKTVLKSALSEKDQQDLLNMLRQQNKLNEPSRQTKINANAMLTNFKKSYPAITIKNNNYPVLASNQTPRSVSNQIVNPPQNLLNQNQSTSTQIEREDFSTQLISKATILKTTDLIQSRIMNSQAKTASIAVQSTSKTNNAVIKSVDTIIKPTHVPAEVSLQSTPAATTLANASQDIVKIAWVSNIEKKYKSSKKNWTSVMDDLRKQKTPNRGPNALEMVLDSDAYEKYTNTQILRNQRIVRPKSENNQQSITNQEVEKSIQAPTPTETISKVSIQPVKPAEAAQPKIQINIELANNQPVVKIQEILKAATLPALNCETLREDDPFISGILNSEYELLEELMDDDLRKEIGELSSDEERSYTTPTITEDSNKKITFKSDSNIVNESLSAVTNRLTPSITKGSKKTNLKSGGNIVNESLSPETNRLTPSITKHSKTIIKSGIINDGTSSVTNRSTPSITKGSKKTIIKSCSNMVNESQSSVTNTRNLQNPIKSKALCETSNPVAKKIVFKTVDVKPSNSASNAKPQILPHEMVNIIRQHDIIQPFPKKTATQISQEKPSHLNTDSSSQKSANVDAKNVIITVPPQPSSNMLIIRPDMAYEPYPTLHIKEAPINTNINQSYVAANTQTVKNIQLTTFTPVVAPVIINHTIGLSTQISTGAAPCNEVKIASNTFVPANVPLIKQYNASTKIMELNAASGSHSSRVPNKMPQISNTKKKISRTKRKKYLKPKETTLDSGQVTSLSKPLVIYKPDNINVYKGMQLNSDTPLKIQSRPEEIIKSDLKADTIQSKEIQKIRNVLLKIGTRLASKTLKRNEFSTPNKDEFATQNKDELANANTPVEVDKEVSKIDEIKSKAEAKMLSANVIPKLATVSKAMPELNLKPNDASLTHEIPASEIHSKTEIKHSNFDLNISKPCERKVLSEVQEKLTTPSPEKAESKLTRTQRLSTDNDKTMENKKEKEIFCDRERVKKKRWAIINREITQRCFDSAIALPYAPIQQVKFLKSASEKQSNTDILNDALTENPKSNQKTHTNGPTVISQLSEFIILNSSTPESPGNIENTVENIHDKNKVKGTLGKAKKSKAKRAKIKNDNEEENDVKIEKEQQEQDITGKVTKTTDRTQRRVSSRIRERKLKKSDSVSSEVGSENVVKQSSSSAIQQLAVAVSALTRDVQTKAVKEPSISEIPSSLEHKTICKVDKIVSTASEVSLTNMDIEPTSKLDMSESIDDHLKNQEEMNVEPTTKLETPEAIEGPSQYQKEMSVEPTTKLETPEAIEGPSQYQKEINVEPAKKLETPEAIEGPSQYHKEINVEPATKLETPEAIKSPSRYQKEINVEPTTKLDTSKSTDVYSQDHKEINVEPSLKLDTSKSTDGYSQDHKEINVEPNPKSDMSKSTDSYSQDHKEIIQILSSPEDTPDELTYPDVNNDTDALNELDNKDTSVKILNTSTTVQSPIISVPKLITSLGDRKTENVREENKLDIVSPGKSADEISMKVTDEKKLINVMSRDENGKAIVDTITLPALPIGKAIVDTITLPALPIVEQTLPENKTKSLDTDVILVDSDDAGQNEDVNCQATKNTNNFDNSDYIPESYKRSIIFRELPPDLNNPKMRCVRIQIPNGKIFKATIYGEMNINFDTLFEDPALKNILLSGISDKKRFTFSVQQTATLNRKIIDTRVKLNSGPSNNNMNSEFVNLISDDEDDDQSNRSKQNFTTEFGTYHVNSMEENTYKKHQSKLSQKCSVKLKNCDYMVSKPAITSQGPKREKLNQLINAVLHPDVEESNETLPHPLVENNILNDNSKGLSSTATEIINLDDSSDEDTPSNIHSVNKIDELKNLLLKDLGVLDVFKDSTTFYKETEKKKGKSSPRKKYKSQKKYKAYVEPIKNDYSDIISYKCFVKLTRCDNLVQNFKDKLTVPDILNKDTDAYNDFEPKLSRSGSFSILNDLDRLDDVIELTESDTERSSPTIDIDPTITALHGTLETDSCMSPNFVPTVNAPNYASYTTTLCYSDWLHTKKDILRPLTCDVVSESDTHVDVTDSKTDVSTDYESDTDITFCSSNISDLQNTSVTDTSDVPSLKKIMTEYYVRDSTLHQNHSMNKNKNALITCKRKLLEEHNEVATKISKIKNYSCDNLEPEIYACETSVSVDSSAVIAANLTKINKKDSFSEEQVGKSCKDLKDEIAISHINNISLKNIVYNYIVKYSDPIEQYHKLTDFQNEMRQAGMSEDNVHVGCADENTEALNENNAFPVTVSDIEAVYLENDKPRGLLSNIELNAASDLLAKEQNYTKIEMSPSIIQEVAKTSEQDTAKAFTTNYQIKGSDEIQILDGKSITSETTALSTIKFETNSLLQDKNSIKEALKDTYVQITNDIADLDVTQRNLSTEVEDMSTLISENESITEFLEKLGDKSAESPISPIGTPNVELNAETASELLTEVEKYTQMEMSPSIIQEDATTLEQDTSEGFITNYQIEGPDKNIILDQKSRTTETTAMSIIEFETKHLMHDDQNTDINISINEALKDTDVEISSKVANLDVALQNLSTDVEGMTMLCFEDDFIAESPEKLGDKTTEAPFSGVLMNAAPESFDTGSKNSDLILIKTTITANNDVTNLSANMKNKITMTIKNQSTSEFSEEIGDKSEKIASHDELMESTSEINDANAEVTKNIAYLDGSQPDLGVDVENNSIMSSENESIPKSSEHLGNKFPEIPLPETLETFDTNTRNSDQISEIACDSILDINEDIVDSDVTKQGEDIDMECQSTIFAANITDSSTKLKGRPHRMTGALVSMSATNSEATFPSSKRISDRNSDRKFTIVKDIAGTYVTKQNMIPAVEIKSMMTTENLESLGEPENKLYKIYSSNSEMNSPNIEKISEHKCDTTLAVIKDTADSDIIGGSISDNNKGTMENKSMTVFSEEAEAQTELLAVTIQRCCNKICDTTTPEDTADLSVDNAKKSDIFLNPENKGIISTKMKYSTQLTAEFEVKEVIAASDNRTESLETTQDIILQPSRNYDHIVQGKVLCDTKIANEDDISRNLKKENIISNACLDGNDNLTPLNIKVDSDEYAVDKTSEITKVADRNNKDEIKNFLCGDTVLSSHETKDKVASIEHNYNATVTFRNNILQTKHCADPYEKLTSSEIGKSKKDCEEDISETILPQDENVIEILGEEDIELDEVQIIVEGQPLTLDQNKYYCETEIVEDGSVESPMDSSIRSPAAEANNTDENTLSEKVSTLHREDTGVVLKGIEYGTYYVFALDKSSDSSANNSNTSVESVEETQINERDNENLLAEPKGTDNSFDCNAKMEVMIPKQTYSRRNLKRKLGMLNIPLPDKKRKILKLKQSIESQKLSKAHICNLMYTRQFTSLLKYCSNVKFSYSISFHKEQVDLENILNDWPIKGDARINSQEIEESDEASMLFTDLDLKLPFDPMAQTLSEELSTEYLQEESCEAGDSNFNMGFGERSGRVNQNFESDGVTKFSAATLSDVKHSQPFLLSEDCDDCDSENGIISREKDQLEKIKRSIAYIQLRDKVRSFFAKTAIELASDIVSNKDKENPSESTFPFNLYIPKSFQPAPADIVVRVVQVGQLPVSAAAQNPVTCDPRVTQVSDASPSQCSEENSPRDDLQQGIKTEYTELTTADLSMPMETYQNHNQNLPIENEEAKTGDNIPIETELIKSEVKIELVEETSEDTEMDENIDDASKLSTSNHANNIDYTYETNNINTSMEQDANMEMIQPTQDMYSQQKQQNGAPEKTDQIAHAMSAAGISTTAEPVQNARAQALVNIISQKIRHSNGNSVQNPINTYSKSSPITAMALQQALAQILPPPLNQTNATESNQQGQNPTVTPQVLHIVQGKNASGNQITLVDNSQQSVINQNATPVLHIVQNKGPNSAPNSSGNTSHQQNAFSGLSLVDTGLQQGGNQLLHIVNTGNQKNTNAGQLLKRVNLLTNLTNVPGSNEQKMVQFVCKSADGKSIQLNAPHQRSMVLRLQPIESPSVQHSQPKPTENQDMTSPNTPNSGQNKESANSQHEIKSRSMYEENYAKFIQSSTVKPVGEKSTSLPKFNQAFGKSSFQDGNQKQTEISVNNPHLPPAVNANNDNTGCPPADNNSINLDHISQMSSPPLLLRKSPQTSQTQQNLVQQIKQTIAPMNIQTMHGGVIYTRQIPVNIGGGQTINLITVPSTELIDDKQQSEVKFVSQSGEIEPSIIKIVPQSQPAPNAEVTQDESNNVNMNSDNAQNPQPQPVLTQMRIKLPMLSKTPQVVSGARVVRPSFFQIQRNVIGGPNQQVYQQLVLTAAPPLGQQTIRLPQSQAGRPVKVPSETQSSPESQMSSSTLEQLREFDMVLEQVKERSTVQPNLSAFKLNATSDTTDSNVSGSSTPVETTQPVLYSIGGSQQLNVAYVNRKAAVATPSTSTFVRSPDSSSVADSPGSSNQTQTSHSVSNEPSSSGTSSQSRPRVSSKSKSRPKSTHSQVKINSVPPKPTTQKPLEDEQTTQRILYILAEYKEQVENSPDKDKPAPRRRSNPPSNPGSSKRKKSSSGSRRPGARDVSPVQGDDACRTMGSEDSSCGTSQGDCTESCMETHSPQDSPRKVARKLTFEQEPAVNQHRPQPQRNVIVADGQAITVARAAGGKPATAVLMPANYILPVSMVKGGQQIAIVTNRGPKLLTVGGGEGGGTNALLLQRLISPAGLKPVLARPGVRHVRLPTAALHNLQTFNLASATTVQPPDSTASPTAAPTPPELIETRAENSPWTERDSESVRPERPSSPEGSEPWNMPTSSEPQDYSYEETVRAENMDRTVLDPIPDRYSPDMEAQRIFDKMFDVESKKCFIVDSHDEPHCGYGVDASEDDKGYQVVQKKEGPSHRQHRVTHISAAALRHKYAILEHELRLQKSLSEECEDLGVDSPSASELFPEAELLFAASPAQDHGEASHHHPHTSQPTINQTAAQPELDDQIATDQLLPRAAADAPQPRPELDVNLGLGDVGIVTVSEDGMQATIALDQEEFARSHPNTTFHSEPTDVEVQQPFTITGIKGGRQISTIFHANRVPATVLMTAPQTTGTVISQTAAAEPTAPTTQGSIKYSNIDHMITTLPSSHTNNVTLNSVLVKDDGLTRFDNILTDSRELHLSNTASAIVHPAGNTTQVIRRVCYDDKRERDARYLMDEPDTIIAGDDAKMIAEDSSRDATMESMVEDVDDDNSSSERHAELFWESNSASERSESRRPLDFSSDSEKGGKSPSYDETNSTDSSGVGSHVRHDSVIKEARFGRSGSAEGSSADDTHPPLRTYPPKRMYHNPETEMERSLSGKTRAGEHSPDLVEGRRRTSVRGVVKRGCHCCNGSPTPAAPRPKKPRQKKPTLDFNTNT